MVNMDNTGLRSYLSFDKVNGPISSHKTILALILSDKRNIENFGMETWIAYQTILLGCI